MITSKLPQMQSVLLTLNMRRFKLILKSSSHHASAKWSFKLYSEFRGLPAGWQVAHWKALAMFSKSSSSRGYLLLRHNFATTNIAVTCICGELNTVYQTLICKRGPFVNCRHNRPRDVIAELLNKCLPEVWTTSPASAVTGESSVEG